MGEYFYGDVVKSKQLGDKIIRAMALEEKRRQLVVFFLLVVLSFTLTYTFPVIQ